MNVCDMICVYIYIHKEWRPSSLVDSCNDPQSSFDMAAIGIRWRRFPIWCMAYGAWQLAWNHMKPRNSTTFPWPSRRGWRLEPEFSFQLSIFQHSILPGQRPICLLHSLAEKICFGLTYPAFLCLFLLLSICSILQYGNKNRSKFSKVPYHTQLEK